MLKVLPTKVKSILSQSSFDKSISRLNWVTPPRTAFICKKPQSLLTDNAFDTLLERFKSKHPKFNFVVDSNVYTEYKHRHKNTYKNLFPLENRVENYKELERVTDFIITIGGDGTLLKSSEFFPTAELPPIISFSLGSLGFLVPFDFKEDFETSIDSIIRGDVDLLMRDRLSCQTKGTDEKILKQAQIMNEVTLHRGAQPHLINLNISINEKFLGETISDGLIISTPTGSTAYSLSCGGPIVHPSVSCILLTPICPQSLSFRPLVLPHEKRLTLSVSQKSRNLNPSVSVDGRDFGILKVGESIDISTSLFPFPCLLKQNSSWTSDLRNVLKWNQSFIFQNN